MININPKRLPGEKFKTYRARLREAHAAIKRYLRGRVVIPSSQIVVIPVLGADAQADAAVIDGKYRDVVDVKLKDGKETRIGRTKGVAYRTPAAVDKPCHKRAVRRGMQFSFPNHPVVPTRDAVFDDRELAQPTLRQRIGMLLNGSPVAS